MAELDFRRLLDQLIRLEGDRLAVYRDSDGKLLIADDQYAQSAGVSRRTLVLEIDVRRVARELDERWPGLRKLDPVRQRVMIHMAFNLGVSGLLCMGRFVSAVDFHFWDTAAQEIVFSPWAKADKQRALVLADMMRGGRDEIECQTRHP
jgi:lysozyme